ncbi:hypothetical protein CUZ56_01928 [Saezia sanguinis]|uniref:Uncharacterized protein n=1 Tax=Saezia sanguinis TaxID=1965230 RepID=A0A433SD24_9BURK|nr:hypothetical protein CUZ56_01928 [Saezia sanguinis]
MTRCVLGDQLTVLFDRVPSIHLGGDIDMVLIRLHRMHSTAPAVMQLNSSLDLEPMGKLGASISAF